MNRERIQILRDTLAALPDERFNMSWWFSTTSELPHPMLASSGDWDATKIKHDCGTAACIAGWTLALFNPIIPAERHVTYDDEPVAHYAGQVLGLSEEQAEALFTPEGYGISKSYTREAAIATLDRLLKTGEVQW